MSNNMADIARLHPIDYVVLVLLIVLSSAIGIYHGRQQRSSREFFLASRSLGPLPVSVSLALSVVSAITFLGMPSLSYFGGMAFLPTAIGYVLGGFVTAFVICPVLYNLQITSIYEYLEKRFNPIVRYIAVCEQILLTFLMLGIVVYAPALALNAVTGLSLSGSIATIGLVSTFYSSIGGIKAVVWNDFVQGIILLVGFIVLIVTGIIKTGGIGETISRVIDGQRATIADFRLDPTIPLTVWSTVIGGIFMIVTYGGTNQNQSQRFLSCKDLRSAKLAIIWGFNLIGLIVVLAVLTGVTIYAYYSGCDPYITGKIEKADQILPYFVVDVFEGVPGMPGFLLAAVFCAALSTISTAINGITTVTGADVIRKIWPDIPDLKFTTLMKILSVCYGISFMLMAFLASASANLLVKLGQSVAGAITGPVLGVFLLGILVPRSSSKGAIAGMFIGTLLGVWLLLGSLVHPKPPTALPLSTLSCPVDVPVVHPTYMVSDFTTISSVANSTTEIDPADVNGSTGPLFAGFYAVSFLYIGVISTVPTFLVGLAVAMIAPSASPVDSALLSPVLWKRTNKTRSFWFQNVQYKKQAEVNINDEDKVQCIT